MMDNAQTPPADAGRLDLGVRPDAEALKLTDSQIADLTDECKKLRQAAEYAAHKLEGARIWNGTEWHYNPLHPLHYRSALERLRDVLRA